MITDDAGGAAMTVIPEIVFIKLTQRLLEVSVLFLHIGSPVLVHETVINSSSPALIK